MARWESVGRRQPTPRYERKHNPFSEVPLAAGYESWYQNAGRRADHLEKQLFKWLLAGFPTARTLLDAGTGTGHFARWFREQGLRVAGLDLALPMLAEAKELDEVPYICGDAQRLPFADGAFDLVTLITTLEFVSCPAQVLRESQRVAGQGLILGVLNRHSLLGWQRKLEAGPLWATAHFFSPLEILSLLNDVVSEPMRLVWRTTLWPLWPGILPLPWGGFMGLAAHWGPEVDGGQR
jgi:ubiquinone/menaquinone biosynthesis C-methylase UbiE